MTSHEARLLLQSRRPGDADSRDPIFAEALEQVRRDPELARWFEAERKLDAALSAKLRELPPPAGLQAEILAIGTAAASRRRWPRRVTLAAAAVITLSLALTTVWFRALGAPEFAAFRDEMIRRTSSDPEHLAFASRNMDDIRKWLRARGVASEFELPAGLRSMTLHGCRVLDWNGRKVALVCLVPEGGPHLDLLMIDCAYFRDFRLPGAPLLGRSGDLTTAVWTAGGKTYLVASRMDTEQLRNLL